MVIYAFTFLITYLSSTWFINKKSSLSLLRLFLPQDIPELKDFFHSKQESGFFQYQGQREKRWASSLETDASCQYILVQNGIKIALFLFSVMTDVMKLRTKDPKYPHKCISHSQKEITIFANLLGCPLRSSTKKSHLTHHPRGRFMIRTEAAWVLWHKTPFSGKEREAQGVTENVTCFSWSSQEGTQAILKWKADWSSLQWQSKEPELFWEWTAVSEYSSTSQDIEFPEIRWIWVIF
jgi:hypothetical protein